MKKGIVIVSLVCLLCSAPLSVEAKSLDKSLRPAFNPSYDEAIESAKRVIRYINLADTIKKGDWDAITISGLYCRLYEKITEEVTKDGKEKGYKIAEIEYSKDNKYFSIRVEKSN